MATGGLNAGSPMSMVTDGLLQPRSRFKYLGSEKSGVAGALDYRQRFETTTDSLDGELVPGEYVDELAVLRGTTTA